MKQNNLNLSATTSQTEAFEGAHFVIIAIPTNFRESLNSFDTNSLEEVIKNINHDSTYYNYKIDCSIGFTKSQNLLYKKNNIIFSPEFLKKVQL